MFASTMHYDEVAGSRMPPFKKIAHRGASGQYPENTRSAFLGAIEAGADMVELDCQLTADGHVVVFHDEQLRRITGARGAVRSKSLEQLKRLDAGRWRKKAFAGERILTLEEALGVLDGRVDLCLEIKTFGQSAPGIELKILFILSHYEYLERTVLSSFDYNCLARVRELAPDAAIGVIFGADVRHDPFAAARRLGARSIHVQSECATREFLACAWDDGFDVYVWTVNERSEIEFFISMGVQGLISDYPERLSRLAAVR